MNSQKGLIVLSGLVGVGKTTIADSLKVIFDEMRVSSKRVNLADPIRNHFKLLSGKVSDYKPKREELVSWGQEFKRLWGKDIFAQFVVSKMFQTSEDIFICDDLRFPEELVYFKRQAKKLGFNLLHFHLTVTPIILRDRIFDRKKEIDNGKSFEEIINNEIGTIGYEIYKDERLTKYFHNTHFIGNYIYSDTIMRILEKSWDVIF